MRFRIRLASYLNEFQPESFISTFNNTCTKLITICPLDTVIFTTDLWTVAVGEHFQTKSLSSATRLKQNI